MDEGQTASSWYHHASSPARAEDLSQLPLGATPGEAAILILWEAALVGCAGGALGLTAAAVAARVADWAFLRFLPDFPGRPAQLVTLAPAVLAGAMVLALVAALAGALAPARAAARLDPARTLAEG